MTPAIEILIHQLKVLLVDWQMQANVYKEKGDMLALSVVSRNVEKLKKLIQELEQ